MQIMWCVVSTPIAGLQEQLMKAFQSFIKLLYLETKKENQAAAQVSICVVFAGADEESSHAQECCANWPPFFEIITIHDNFIGV